MADPKQHVQFAKDPVGILDDSSHGALVASQRTPYPTLQQQEDISELDPHSHERRKAWVKKATLTIDGGGVRGYSSLLILQALMREIQKVEQFMERNPSLSSADSEHVGTSDPDKIYRPCHYFDYIAGSAAAAVIAIVLGRYRKTVEEALVEYRQLCAKLLKEQTFPGTLFGKGRIDKQKWLDEHLQSMEATWPSPEEVDGNLLSDPNRCRTLAYAMDLFAEDGVQNAPCRRSYVKPGIVDPRFTWYQVAKQIPRHRVLLGDPSRQVEADFMINNPSIEVVIEIDSEATGSDDGVDVLVSIGGANRAKLLPWPGDPPRGSQRRQELKAEESDRLHQKVRLESKQRPFEYHRLDVFDRLKDLNVNEWQPSWNGKRTLQRIADATNEYFQSNDPTSGQSVRAELQAIAKVLVEKRRLRAADTRWERWATGVIYRCPVLDCPDWNLRFEERGDLYSLHLRNAHNVSPPDSIDGDRTNALMDLGRTTIRPLDPTVSASEKSEALRLRSEKLKIDAEKCCKVWKIDRIPFR